MRRGRKNRYTTAKAETLPGCIEGPIERRAVFLRPGVMQQQFSALRVREQRKSMRHQMVHCRSICSAQPKKPPGAIRLPILKLKRPVLARHSVAGEELRSIGSRHPEKVAGLVYLEAAHAYAVDNPVLSCSLPPPPPQQSSPKTVTAAIQAGTQRYTNIKSPALAIYATPKERAPAEGAARTREACAKAFEKGAPASRIVRLPGATHYVFISNEADVLKEMRDFIGGLKN
jgi:pimeloyl-ACP methyl ester carboxylesterase